MLGLIGNGETISFDLPAGRHEVYFKIDWARSNKVVLNLNQNETTTINVGANVRGWKLLLAFFYIFFMPHKYLWAKIEKS